MPEVLTDKTLSGRDLDAAIAERVMGYSRYSKSASLHYTDNRTINGVLYCHPDFGDFDFGGQLNAVPEYSSSIKAAMNVEDRIAQLGLQSPYYRSLVDIVATAIKDRLFHHFDVVHATPEQRCLAALKALESNDGNRKS